MRLNTLDTLRMLQNYRDDLFVLHNELFSVLVVIM